MLDQRYQSQLKTLLASLECHVEIPEEWRDTYFQTLGPVSTAFEDRRRYRRHNFRTRIVLEITQSLPAIERTDGYFSVYTRDFARNSVSFLHTSQLYPSENLHLWLPNRRRSFRVSNCRRFNDRCYLIGAIAVDDAVNAD